MADDDTLVLGRGSGPQVRELLDVYTMTMTREVQAHGDLDEARARALVMVAGRAVETERARIANRMMRRSLALDPHRERPTGDPLVEGLAQVAPWRWLRFGIARVVYRVLADMVRRDLI